MNRRSARFRRVATIAGLLALIGGRPAWAHDTNLTRARIAVARLELRWGVPGGWRGINAWQRFVIADELMDYVEATGERGRLPRLYHVVRSTRGLDGNDDDLWAVLAWLHAYRLSGDRAWLTRGEAVFDRLVADYWDDRCGGGLWWDHARTYKNAITTALMVKAAAELYQASGEPRYRDGAMRAWSWFDASAMIGPTGLANDGLSAACRNNAAKTFTYIQGVLIDGVDELGRIEGRHDLRARAQTIAMASLAQFWRSGVLTEPASPLGRDGPMFKGILVAALGRNASGWPSRPKFATALARSGDRLWTATGRGRRPAPSIWDKRAARTGAAAQSSAVALYVAAWRLGAD